MTTPERFKLFFVHVTAADIASSTTIRVRLTEPIQRAIRLYLTKYVIKGIVGGDTYLNMHIDNTNMRPHAYTRGGRATSYPLFVDSANAYINLSTPELIAVDKVGETFTGFDIRLLRSEGVSPGAPATYTSAAFWFIVESMSEDRTNMDSTSKQIAPHAVFF